MESQDSTKSAQETCKKYLTFCLGSEAYALPIDRVTEIVGKQEITFIPDVPHYVKGVINLRGKVIPVIDVRLRFGQMEREYDRRTCTIVIDSEATSVGLIVDQVREVRDIDLDDIEPPPGMAVGGGAGFMSGIAKIEGNVMLVLDADQVLGKDTFDGFM